MTPENSSQGNCRIGWSAKVLAIAVNWIRKIAE